MRKPVTWGQYWAFPWRLESFATIVELRWRAPTLCYRSDTRGCSGRVVTSAKSVSANGTLSASFPWRGAMFKLVPLALSALFVLGTATAGSHPDTCVCSRYAPHKGPKPSTPLTVVYTNKHYRFRFYLPQDWNGFSIVANSWTGGVHDKNGQIVADMIECGPQINIRNPLWTGDRPYKDTFRSWYSHTRSGSWPRRNRCQSAQHPSLPSRSVEIVSMYLPFRRVGVLEISSVTKKSST
jgi:hypothetical protein